MSHPYANNREDLTGEHSLGDLGQIIFCILFSTIWIVDTFFLKYTVFMNQLIPWLMRVLFGGLFLIASFIFSFNGLKVVFLEPRDPPDVIRNGVFGIVRHPIYLGEILFYAGLMMFSLSIAAGLVLVGAVSFLVFISQYEEKLLLDRFGEKYSAYMQEVPMLIPRINGIKGK